MSQQHRRDVQCELILHEPGLGQQLDRVTQFAGKTDVHLVQRSDALPIDCRQRHRGAEGDLGKDCQLVSGVGAVHVERWIGLGITTPLGLSEGGSVAVAVLAHARKDEVAGAVENAL